MAIVIEQQNYKMYKNVWTVSMNCPECHKLYVVDFFASYDEAIELKNKILKGGFVSCHLECKIPKIESTQCSS